MVSLYRQKSQLRLREAECILQGHTAGVGRAEVCLFPHTPLGGHGRSAGVGGTGAGPESLSSLRRDAVGRGSHRAQVLR
jgi:hypothetical protein